MAMHYEPDDDHFYCLPQSSIISGVQPKRSYSSMDDAPHTVDPHNSEDIKRYREQSQPFICYPTSSNTLLNRDMSSVIPDFTEIGSFSDTKAEIVSNASSDISRSPTPEDDRDPYEYTSDDETTLGSNDELGSFDENSNIPCTNTGQNQLHEIMLTTPVIIENAYKAILEVYETIPAEDLSAFHNEAIKDAREMVAKFQQQHTMDFMKYDLIPNLHR